MFKLTAEHGQARCLRVCHSFRIEAMKRSAFQIVAVVLRHFAPKIREAQEKRLQWLLENEPSDTVDSVYQLSGLVVGEADDRTILARWATLIDLQQSAGSWSQLPVMDGDADAAGSVLFALGKAGLSPEDPVYLREVEYLVGTQQADGSWFVESRTRVVQPFFDNGDPGWKLQFICFAATNWATLALLEVIPRESLIDEAVHSAVSTNF